MGQTKHIFGYHTVVSALSSMPEGVRLVYLQGKQTDKRTAEIIELAEQHQISIKYLSREHINSMFPMENHQGVIAEVVYQGEYSENYLEVILEKNGAKTLLLILDGVQDPHNLGACLRTANAAGVHAIIVPKDNACGLTPTVYKVASGAAGIVPLIQVTNLSRTIRFLKENNIWVYGTAEDAEQSIYQAKFTTPMAMVYGAEGKGLRRLTKENCDLMVNIPMQGAVSSLNVSVAVGVGLFEVVRQSLARKA